MLLDNHQQLHHTFYKFYICQGNKLSKNYFQKQDCNIFLEFYTNQEQNQIQKKHLLKALSHIP